MASRSSFFIACTACVALAFACGAPSQATAPELASGLEQARLGASWGRDGIHFAVRADAAEVLEVDLYATARGADEVLRVTMSRVRTGAPWTADVGHDALQSAGLSDAVYYGFRAWGPNWHLDPTWTKGSGAGFVKDVDEQGDRFNPNKLLLDPYAREISHDPVQPDGPSANVYASGAASRELDTGRLAPKSVVWAQSAATPSVGPSRALGDDVIYEVQLRGFTKNALDVPDALRGTFAGAAMKANDLAALGVTAVEFLPIHETQNDTNDSDPGSANYWGYSTLAFFAPDRRFASDKSPGGPTREFKSMVDAFHAHGMKVLLDVVYNHTAEKAVSPSSLDVARLLSFRGLDNAAYYELGADHQSQVDNTGTGGNFNTASEVVRDLILDSLQYWHRELGVDGFRFDLAVVLGNSCTSVCYKFAPNDPRGVLERAVQELPARSSGGGDGVDLIAEPWASGPGTYQLGHFPRGWAEWNGTFRDLIRTEQNELGATAPASLAAKVGGSPDLFGHDDRSPAASINYLSCHDGMTLNDVYAYNAPNNAQPFPYGPSPGGSSINHAWNQNGDPGAQRQAIRTGLALVAVSAGVPMIQGGDEMGRTQRANNNSFNLDDSAMWLDWSLAQTNRDLVDWTRGLLAFRSAHPVFRPASFRNDIAWLDASAASASDAYMKNKSNTFLAWRLDGVEAGDTVRSVYVAWNAGANDVPATVPQPATTWSIIANSASGVLDVQGAQLLEGSSIVVPARSILVLAER
jgi:glycogen operon protein